ncbi:MAG: hypothetical protein ACI311_06480 [Bacilli bacterium]
MKKYFNKKINDNIYEEFNSYIIGGGFLKTIEFDDLTSKQLYTKDIIGEIYNKDVKTKNSLIINTIMYLLMS